MQKFLLFLIAELIINFISTFESVSKEEQMKHSLILSGYDSFYYINFQGNKIILDLHYISSAVNSKNYSLRDENNEEEKNSG